MMLELDARPSILVTDRQASPSPVYLSRTAHDTITDRESQFIINMNVYLLFS